MHRFSVLGPAMGSFRNSENFEPGTLDFELRAERMASFGKNAGARSVTALPDNLRSGMLKSAIRGGFVW